MSLKEYLRISIVNIRKNIFLIAAVTLVFFLTGILYASWQTVTNTYIARTTIYAAVSGNTVETAATASALTGYSDIISSKKICERAEAIIGDASINANMIGKMVYSSYNKSSTILTISASSSNPSNAIKVANAVAEAFVLEVQMITGNDRIQILDEAEDVRMSSNGLQGIIKTVVTFGVSGLLLSNVLIVLIIMFTNKIKSVEQCMDIDEDDVLGIIPLKE